MTDIIYIIGNGSGWQNNELRYSLRSVAKYGRNVGNVYVIGEHIPFASDAVKQFSAPDNKGGIYKNVLSKIHFAMREIKGLSESVLVFNDDFFICKDFDADAYPYFYRGELSIVGDGRGWLDTLYNARKFLEASGKTTLSYEEHCPIAVNKTEWNQLSDLWQSSLGVGYGMAWRSVYANWFNKGGEYLHDRKFSECRVEDVTKDAENRLCISTDDNGLKNGVAKWLEDTFIEPSKYERVC